MENNILNMKLTIDTKKTNINNDVDYIVRIINKENEEESYEFKLSDETTDNLKKFINYLLERINNYDELNIDFQNEEKESLKSIIGTSIKEIWEYEFSKVKEKIKSI